MNTTPGLTAEPDLIERFDRVATRMPSIAEAVAGFGDDLRQNVYYTLVSILDPVPDEGGAAHREVAAERDRLQAQIGRLADFITAEMPGEASHSEGAVDTAIRILASYLTTTTPRSVPGTFDVDGPALAERLADADMELLALLDGAARRWGLRSVVDTAALLQEADVDGRWAKWTEPGRVE